MVQNVANATLSVARPQWDNSRLVSRIVHLGCGAFHRAHQALYTHRLLETTDSDWGYCEVNLMPGNDARLIQALKDQNMLYTVAERGAESTALKVIGSMKEALHPEFDGCDGILNAMARPETAIVSLTVTEKGYCIDAASSQLDLNNSFIQHDLAHPQQPKSAIGYIVEALAMRRERGLPGFTVMSCDNLRENGHAAKAAVLGLAQARDPALAAWIAGHVTFPCTMVDRIVPAVTEESLQQVADQLGVFDPCAIACEPFIQWVIEDNFVNGRPDWDKAGAQFVADVVPFEMMKLRMLNGSHSFLAYLGYLGGYETISDTMTNPAYRKAARALMLNEQAPTLSMPQGTDLVGYADLLIERYTNPSLRHRTWQIAMDGSQKLPQRMLDPVRIHLKNGDDFRHLTLGVAGWMRYVSGVDEQGNAIDVVDPLAARYREIHQQYQEPEARVRALLAIETIFSKDLPANAQFVAAVTHAYLDLLKNGARATVEALA
ncbi:fructuronate reductase [Shimwellia blattae]|uniref:D-mannonate oxidoreductase n=1 Tax=Shimwellia blattae (strain ATCC 29907 / DSM 4481 / JCM 1650 / NBRC 105725 / CDC 9005-74) TaxID=630626 RepID=I2B5T7_SHIBC|nr:fructuronate reductase [Shimwellia blattae]AFJ45891.1 D-mannonate oxidoreductase [Shimwellia blattae DSM 4481 = NBRC 105725]GAB81651.1 D-mannonate oxidoreductase [Shimwellia blattae DSM 4481 = NBRC 105725]VDY63369.1 Polyol:NADP oxidoreductase [Shimwellia blattae]VEC21196.1 Polyol:NADP oxidoreductase [Shimwellia blattae]